MLLNYLYAREVVPAQRRGLLLPRDYMALVRTADQAVQRDSGKADNNKDHENVRYGNDCIYYLT